MAKAGPWSAGNGPGEKRRKGLCLLWRNLLRASTTGDSLQHPFRVSGLGGSRPCPWGLGCGAAHFQRLHLKVLTCCCVGVCLFLCIWAAFPGNARGRETCRHSAASSCKPGFWPAGDAQVWGNRHGVSSIHTMLQDCTQVALLDDDVLPTSFVCPHALVLKTEVSNRRGLIPLIITPRLPACATVAAGRNHHQHEPSIRGKRVSVPGRCPPIYPILAKDLHNSLEKNMGREVMASLAVECE